jgi:hypothetical protein
MSTSVYAGLNPFTYRSGSAQRLSERTILYHLPLSITFPRAAREPLHNTRRGPFNVGNFEALVYSNLETTDTVLLPAAGVMG